MATIRFADTSIHGALAVLFRQNKKILANQELLMSRGDDIKADIEVLRAEQRETAQAAVDALARVGAKVDALNALVATLTAGQVSDDELAAINAATAEIKAEADASQAQFAAVEPPAEPTA
jgi:hypothetical protein